MDCKTARFLLECARPASAEMDPTEAGALEEHLSACEICDQQARAERRADEAVGKAMRRVDVPDQLRGRILARLKDERGDVRRRRISYGLCGAAAAAALLLLMLGGWRWFFPRPDFPAGPMLTEVRNHIVAPWTPDAVKAEFKRQGVETAPPTDLNYNYLRWTFLANVEGRQTPMLMFHNARGDNTRSRLPQDALVFIVSDGQFNVDALPAAPVASTDYEYKCDVHHVHGEPFGYVIYYTGDDHAWLDRVETPPGVGEGN